MKQNCEKMLALLDEAAIIQGELTPAVYAVAKRKEQADSDYNHPTYDKWVVNLETRQIEVMWSESCMGDYSEGWISFPVEWLYTPALIENYERNARLCKEEAIRRDKERQERHERKEYEKLKAKFEPPTP